MSELSRDYPNYRNRKKRRMSVVRKKKLVLTVLLTASIGISSVYGVVQGIGNAVDAIEDAYHYNKESKVWYEMVGNHKYTIPGTTTRFIKVYDLANDFKKLEFENKEDVYHNLLGCARFMEYNLDENFRDFVRVLNLDQMAQDNSVYPTNQELFDYIEKLGFLNEDGTIDFEAWRDYDKAVFNMERELEEFKEGKNL